MNILIWNVRFVGLLVFIPSATFGSSDKVTAADIAECGSSIFSRVECSSINYYRECIVPGAETVTAIKVHKKNTGNPCIFKDTFGFRSNAVWVASGCSGEFYVCYTGDEVSTYLPVEPGPTGSVPTGVDLAEATVWESDKAVIYIIIGAVILILFGGGLILGCVVKKRQQREKSRRIAAKRQIRIDKQRKDRDQLDGTITYPGLRSKSLSSTLDSERNHRSFSVDFIDNNDCADNDREGSICSSRSTNSGLTSVSCMTTGRLPQTYNKRFSLDQSLLHGSSTPDIRALKGSSSEINGYTSSRRSKQQGTILYGSQTSLESIREIRNRYQLYEIPLERRFSKQENYKRPIKYNTIGFSGHGIEKPLHSSTMSRPSKRRTVTAVVHAVKADTTITEENKSQTEDRKVIPRCIDEIPPESHYQDPESLLHTPSPTEASPYTTHHDNKVTPWSSIDEGIQKDMTDNHGDTSTDTHNYTNSCPIYATVNKRNKRVELSDASVDEDICNRDTGRNDANSASDGIVKDDSHQPKTIDGVNHDVHTNKYTKSYHCSKMESFRPVEDGIYHSINFI